MKKLFLTLFIIVAMFSAQAYPYLIFKTTDGTVYAMNVESMSISISNADLIATNSEETQTFALADLDRMFFSNDTDGIAEMFSPDAGEVDVFMVTGAYLGKYDNAREATANLRTGVYLLRSKSSTIKIVVK